MGVSKNRGTPKSSILIGFSIIFTIHFGGFPLFLVQHPDTEGEVPFEKSKPFATLFCLLLPGTRSAPDSALCPQLVEGWRGIPWLEVT